jgi:hypothetical protein
MATRAKQARVSSTVAFTGRVREWEQQHVTIAQGLGADTKHSGLQVLRWVPNGEICSYPLQKEHLIPDSIGLAIIALTHIAQLQ